jgi:uncharacterized protein YcfJ
MKNILLATALVVMSTPAFADRQPMATITAIEPRYEYVYIDTPSRQCQNVEVPIYGTVRGGDAGAGALGGMIIGGILGKGVTGNNDGAAAGAVIGGIIGANNAQNGSRQVITGYRTERQCSEVMQRQEQRQVRDYLITYEWHGVVAQSYTYNNYYIGQQIPISVSIVAQ